MLTATGLCLSDTVFSGYRSTPCDVVESALPQAEWVGEAAAVTGAAIVALDKILNQKDPLHVEEVEFPEEAEQDAAEAEKTRLQGEGQANYRREIANGIVDQIKSLQAVGMNVSDVNNVVLFNQYLDTMRNLASSQNTKTVVLPASTPGGFNEMRDQVIAAMEAGK